MNNIRSIVLGIFVVLSHQTNVVIAIEQLEISLLRFHDFQ